MDISHFDEVCDALNRIDRHEVSYAIDIFRDVRGHGKFVWLIGNGGSAATAAHFSNDLLKMGGIRALAIPQQISVLSAFGNDTGWENMFLSPIEILARPGDVLVAISCSGKSRNVIEVMRSWSGRSIVLTGNDHASDLVKLSPSVVIYAESEEITVQEDVHCAVCHKIARELS